MQLDVDGEIQTLAFENLQSVVPMEPDDEATGPTNRVTLSGGSQIAAVDVSIANETLRIEPRRQTAIKVPMKEVRSIRFRAPSPSIDPQWLGLMEQDARGDLLAIRRAGDQLDPVPGFVKGIANRVVQFEMDEDTIDAPIDKLEGIVLRGTDNESGSAIQVNDHYGSRFLVTQVLPSSADEPLKLKMSDSVSHSLPIAHLQSIFFSGGMQLLASQEPARTDYKAYVETKLSSDLQSAWFAPRADGDDVVLSGGGLIEYRIDDQMSKLAGVIKRDRSVDQAGDVTVEIFVDDKSVWKESLADTQPKGFELSVEGASRVRIVADSGDDGDVGDRIRITRPRLLK